MTGHPPPRRRATGLPPALWHSLTALTFGLTACACVSMTWVFFDPRTPLNPFPPPTATPWPTATHPIASPTPAIAAPTLPPEWTPTAEGGIGGAGLRPGVDIPTVATQPAPETLVPAPTTATSRPTGAATATSTTTPAPPSETPAGGGYPYPGQPATTTPGSGYP
jgi:hypothetical protein